MDREIDDKEYRQQLDRYITGNYGEDQFKAECEDPSKLAKEMYAKEMYDAFCKKHIEMFPEIYTPSEKNFQAPEVSGVYTPPTWENLNEKLKQCWIAAASVICLKEKQ